MFNHHRHRLRAESTGVGLTRFRLWHRAAGLAVALLGGAAAQAAEALNPVDHLAPLPSQELGQIAGGASPAGQLPPTSGGVPNVAVILWDEAGKRGHQSASGAVEVTQIASGLLVLKSPATR